MTRLKIPRVPKKSPLPNFMNCIVVGGVADGLFLKNVAVGARFIELSRPQHVRPLETPQQEQPEVTRESDVYEIHPITLTNTDDGEQYLYGICVVEGKQLTWAFERLIVGYVESITNQIVERSLAKIKH